MQNYRNYQSIEEAHTKKGESLVLLSPEQIQVGKEWVPQKNEQNAIIRPLLLYNNTHLHRYSIIPHRAQQAQ